MDVPADSPMTATLSRRALLLGGAAVVALAGIPWSRQAQARIVDRGQAPKTIAGYSWPWTGRPGERIGFHVSTYAPGPYSVEIVRLVCADGLTDGGRHFREERVDARLAASYPGRTQKTFLGSFAHVENVPNLGTGDSFTISLCVYPTSVSRGSRLAGSSFAPLVGQATREAQHLVSRWSAPGASGWALVIDERGRPSFIVGDGQGSTSRVTLDEELVRRRWVRLAVSYDSGSGRISLSQEPVYGGAGDRSSRRSGTTSGQVPPLTQTGPLRLGAAIGEARRGRMAAGAGVLNGKLDKVRIARGALSPQDIHRLQAAAEPAAFQGPVISWWDFARGIGTARIHDISGQGLDGITVNLPVRAVIGVDWNGRTLDWKGAPSQYSALYCHEDALADADWDQDFAYTIPRDLRSGIYAAKLRHGQSQFYIPFYVAPARSRPKARVALVVPTLTYLAYSSAIGHAYWTRSVLVQDPSGRQTVSQEEWMPIYTEEKSAVDMAIRFGPSFGMGVYRFYVDGAPVMHAPMRIPNLANQPGAILKNVTADTDLIEWLEHDRVDYDVITDELLHQEGADLLRGYSTVITGSHTEYLTWEMYDAYLAYLNGGGRLMSIGGNGFHNRVAFHREVPGVVECRKKQAGTAEGNDYLFQAYGEFDGRAAGRFREIGSPANVVHGLGTIGLHPMTAGTYYERRPGGDDPRAAFILAGVGRDERIGDFGKSGGGAASEEVDMADLNDGTPAHALVIASATKMVWPMVGDGGLTDPRYQRNFEVRADMVFFETPGGGAVFSVGSMGWRASLSHNGFDNNVARITRNVLARFSDPAPFAYSG